MRRKVCLLAVAAFIGVALTSAFSGVAAAGTPANPALPGLLAYYTDPQNTNVPYLAWDGEQIRLVKCFTPAELPSVGPGRFVIEDWSGASFQKPAFENSGFFATDG